MDSSELRLMLLYTAEFGEVCKHQVRVPKLIFLYFCDSLTKTQIKSNQCFLFTQHQGVQVFSFKRVRVC